MLALPWRLLPVFVCVFAHLFVLLPHFLPCSCSSFPPSPHIQFVCNFNSPLAQAISLRCCLSSPHTHSPFLSLSFGSPLMSHFTALPRRRRPTCRESARPGFICGQLICGRKGQGTTVLVSCSHFMPEVDLQYHALAPHSFQVDWPLPIACFTAGCTVQ